EGEWSGQSPDNSNPALVNPDLVASDSETIQPAFAGAIEVIKTASGAISDPAAVGDEITYTFRIENTGNTPLVNVELVDDLDGLQGLDGTPITELLPGEVVQRTATYKL